MARGSEHVFRTGKHVPAVRAQFWFLKTPQQQPGMWDKNECFCVSLFEFLVVTKGLFLSLSASVCQGDPWLSHQQTLCVCACVSKCLCVS